MLEVLYLSGELHTRFKLSYHKIMLQSFPRPEVVYMQFNSLVCVCVWLFADSGWKRFNSLSSPAIYHACKPGH